MNSWGKIIRCQYRDQIDDCRRQLEMIYQSSNTNATKKFLEINKKRKKSTLIQNKNPKIFFHFLYSSIQFSNIFGFSHFLSIQPNIIIKITLNKLLIISCFFFKKKGEMVKRIKKKSFKKQIKKLA